MPKPHLTTWFWLVVLAALLLAGCAAEPADAQPPAAPSPVSETLAPAGDAETSGTPPAQGETPTALPVEAQPMASAHLAAISELSNAAGALLTAEQLADSAGAFAQFTGLEGVAASQPELRQGVPDFLARALLFANSQGEPVGLVVAIDEDKQLYIWVNAEGAIACQYTDGSAPLEGKVRADAIDEYWKVILKPGSSCPVLFDQLERHSVTASAMDLVVPAQDAQGNPIDASQQVVVFTARVDAEGNPLLPLILRHNFKIAGREAKDGEMMFQPFSLDDSPHSPVCRKHRTNISLIITLVSK